MRKIKNIFFSDAFFVSFVFFVIFLLCLVILTSCATLTPFLSHQKTFDLTIGTETFTVMLPKDFPDMKDATVTIDRCWDALICQMGFCLGEKPNHDHIHFWYVPDEVPFVLIWIREQEIDPDAKYKCWLYVKGVPVSVDLRKVNQVLQEKLIPKRGGISWNLSYLQ